MNQKYIELVKKVLNDGSIHLCYDSFSTRTFIAEIIHFFLFFGLSVGLLFRKFFLMDNLSEQVFWDILLALIFLLWSFFVLMRVLLLKPTKGDGLKITQNGISKISDENCHVKWNEISCVYPFPWFIGIKSKGKKTLWITFFVKRFAQVTKLFGLLKRKALSQRRHRSACAFPLDKSVARTEFTIS